MSGWVQAVEENREEIIGKWLAGQSINELALYYCLRQPTLERLIRQAFQQTVRLVADQARQDSVTSIDMSAVWASRCRACGAGPGAPCRGTDGLPQKGSVHGARMTDALKAQHLTTESSPSDTPT